MKFLAIILITLNWCLGSNSTEMNTTTTLSEEISSEEINSQFATLYKEPSGNDVNFVCPGNSTRFRISWWVNDQPIIKRKGDPKYRFRHKNQTLNIKRVHVDNSGLYKCEVTTKRGKRIELFDLQVYMRPSIRPLLTTQGSSNKTHLVGDDVTLKCKAYSSDEVTWRKVSFKGKIREGFRKLEDNERVTITKELLQNVTGTKSNERLTTLTIKKVTMKDAGFYRCQATNWLGRDYTEFELYVRNHPPKIFSNYWWILVGFVLVLVFFGNAKFWLRRKFKSSIYQIHDLDCIPQMEELEEPGRMYAHNPAWRTVFFTNDMQIAANDHVTIDAKWKIDRSNIVLDERLDEGFFGQVYRANLIQSNEDGAIINTVCAVKMLKDSSSERDRQDLIREFKQMKRVGNHINVTSLLGVCSNDNLIWLVIEYAEEGNLRDFLRRNRPYNRIENPEAAQNTTRQFHDLTHKDLLSAAHQVANGMEFLVQKKCVHRDLASRNILVTKNLTMKISDFGLSRDIKVKDYYRKKTKGHLPFKWMAIEAMSENLFTHSTDVWSFGILLWEIFTLGKSPYAGVRTNELLQYLKSGNRLEQPEFASPVLYRLMKDCWDENPINRPSFRQLSDDFRLMVSSVSEETLLSAFMPIKLNVRDPWEDCNVEEDEEDTEDDENDILDDNYLASSSSAGFLEETNLIEETQM